MTKVTTEVSEASEKSSFLRMLTMAEQTCRGCHPISAMECTVGCKIWKLKNQCRKLYGRMENPSYMKDLLNVLKNDTRPQILRMLTDKRISLTAIQQRLRDMGFNHSQKTLISEYIDPLVQTGLAEVDEDQYWATVFGERLVEITSDHFEAIDALPTRSECYEEVVLTSLLDNPKTYEELRHFVPSSIVARTLSRLQVANLIATRKEKEYVFYFKSRRDRAKEQLTSAEQMIYGNIPEEGIAAIKLARKATTSMRRTYKYLRKLKGKKLVFARTRPKLFTLTSAGVEAALKLEKMHRLAMETLSALEHLFGGSQSFLFEAQESQAERRKRKEQEFIHLMILQKKAS